MKIMHLEAKYLGDIDIPKNIIEKLPETIGLFTTLQFIDHLPKIKKKIESSGKKVKIFKTTHTKYPGQIYGCNMDKFPGVDAFLYIGDGFFHPKALIIGNNKDVHVYNPVEKKYRLFSREVAKKDFQRQKAGFSSFMMKKNIGVIITTKPGQSYMKLALKLKKDFPDKNYYFIAFDTVNLDRIQDFPFIDVIVNTACPRLGWDDRAHKPLVDMQTIYFYSKDN